MGIKIGIKHRGLPVPEAYMSFGQVSGTAKTGWNGQVRVFASKAARDANGQPLSEFSVNSLGNGPMGPMGGMGGAPASIDEPDYQAPAVGTDPYEALYARLAQMYPTAIRCD